MREAFETGRVLGLARLAVLAAILVLASPASASTSTDPRTSTRSADADAYVLVTGESSMATNLSLEECMRLREQRSGDFLWFRRGGKAYVIEDDAMLREARELFTPLRALEPEQEALRRRQDAVGEEKRELDRQQEDVERQIDGLTDHDGETEGDEDREFIAPEDAPPPTDEEQAELQRQLDELRGQQENLRPRQRELDAKNRDLDEAERALDAREEKLEREAEAKIWSLVDAAVRSGVAKLVTAP